MPAALKEIALRACSSLETLEASYDLARLAIAREVPGDFVECGVFAGTQCAAMALAIMDTKKGGRVVRLFDSFQGVPEPGPHDRQWKAAGHPVGQSAATLVDVTANMAEWGIDPQLLVYHPGWFVQTVPFFGARAKALNEKIAILRIDADLYESTRVCLEHLYPMMSKGGWVIADDFCLDGVRKAFDEHVGYPPVYFQKP